MKHKYTIHADKANDESLRGTGKLDYTNAGRFHSTFQRIASTFSNDEHKPVPGKKDKVKCPCCKKKFKSNNGIIPQHKELFGNGICTQVKGWASELEIVGRIESVTINDYIVKKGDSVAFTTYPWNLYFVNPSELKEYKVKDIYNMDNGKIYFEFYEVKDLVPTHIFVKNFIKL